VSDRILLGHIATVHGIRGEVVIKSYTQDPADIAAYGPLSDEAGRRQFVIETARVTPKGVVARIKGIADRTAAEALRGTALMVARSALPAAGDDEYYHADLIGMTAIGPDGQDIGKVAAVQNFGAGDLLELQLAGRSQTELIPFTDPVVPKIDVKARRITVIMPVMVGEPEPADGDGNDSRDDSEE
jgi:16S rRNA processing protein RimM